jgi:hypothetical protein
MLRKHPQLFNGMRLTTTSQLQTFHADRSSAVPLQVYPVPQFDLRTHLPFTQIVGAVQGETVSTILLETSHLLTMA